MTKTVLIVDDEEDTRLLLSHRLQQAGYITLTAADASTAVARALAQPPDLILLDLVLPEGGGTRVLARLQELPTLAQVPVLVFSGHDHPADVANALALGAVAFLRKGVAWETLLAAIRQALGEEGP